MIAEDDDQFRSEFNTKDAAVLATEGRQFLVKIAFDARQVAEDGVAEGSRREVAGRPPPPPQVGGDPGDENEEERRPQRLAARRVHNQMKHPGGQSSQTPHDHFLLLVSKVLVSKIQNSS